MAQVQHKELNMTHPMTKQDKIWEAESDARTLMEAKVIQKTPARLSAAILAAKRLADEKKKESEGMKAVAQIKRKVLKRASRK